MHSARAARTEPGHAFAACVPAPSVSARVPPAAPLAGAARVSARLPRGPLQPPAASLTRRRRFFGDRPRTAAAASARTGTAHGSASPGAAFAVSAPPRPSASTTPPPAPSGASDSPAGPAAPSSALVRVAPHLEEDEEQPLFVYDAEEVAREFARRPGTVGRRIAEVGAPITAFLAKVVADKQTGRLEENARMRARELRDILTRCGPAFVKVGQALSTRPDLLPQPYLVELSEMQDQLPPFPDKEAYALIEEQTGKRISELFEYLSPSPVAAASLGQVYRGRLRTGEEVAVKEGRNAERFERLYGSLPGVKVPKIYWEATTTRVLTMEWIEGVKLSNQEAIRAAGQDPIHFVNDKNCAPSTPAPPRPAPPRPASKSHRPDAGRGQIGIECTLRQLFEAGFFHADPHPGNLLATPDNTLAFLDFGMMAEAPVSARYALMGHVVHLVNRDFVGMANDYYDLDFLPRDIDTSPIVPALEAFFDDVLQTNVSKLNFKTIVDGLGGVLYQYPFSVPPYYALILRSLTVLEGLAMFTDSDFKVIGKAYPYMARRLLTDPAPELRRYLEELLFKDGQFRWNRLENLVVQASQTYANPGADDIVDSMVEYVFSPGAADLRAKLARASTEGRLECGHRFRPASPHIQGPLPVSDAPSPPRAQEVVRAADALGLDLLDRSAGLAPAPLQPLLRRVVLAPLSSAPAGEIEARGSLLRPEDRELADRLRRILASRRGGLPPSLLPPASASASSSSSSSAAFPAAAPLLSPEQLAALREAALRLAALARRPEAREMGEQIASGFAQRVAARTLRRLLEPLVGAPEARA
eukprot:tig00000404_g418.t1